MARMQLGATGIEIEQNGFGALPIQRVSKGEAVRLLRKAHDGGMTFFDTARGYTDSEEKLGAAFAGMRDQVVLATKTTARDAATFREHLDTSLRLLGTDHVDLYQFHNLSFCPKPGDGTGLYEAMLEARDKGQIRFIGITNHRQDVAMEAIESGLYATLQFPLSYLSAGTDLALVNRCREKGMGFIAMKALSGGLITQARAACAWLTQYPHVVPIWGIQRERELDEFLACIRENPRLDDALMAAIEADRAALQGDFCRGCGYCMPCPQGIQISMCARATLLLRRAPTDILLGESGRAMMRQIEQCTGCGLCASKCPYGLDTPALLKRNYQEYLAMSAEM